MLTRKSNLILSQFLKVCCRGRAELRQAGQGWAGQERAGQGQAGQEQTGQGKKGLGKVKLGKKGLRRVGLGRVGLGKKGLGRQIKKTNKFYFFKFIVKLTFGTRMFCR